MNNETVTNIFWGLFFIWAGISATFQSGNIAATLQSSVFPLGVGGLLILMNLVKAVMHLRVGVITLGLGVILLVIYFPLYFLGFQLPFLPALLVIGGVALIIGTLRMRRYYSD